MKYSKLMIVPVILTFGACNGGGSSSPVQNPLSTPTQDQMMNQASQPSNITPEARAKDAQIFRAMSLKVPGGMDLFSDSDDSGNSSNLRGQSGLDDVGNSFLKQIKASCQFNPGQKPEDTNSSYVQNRAVQGPSCPVNYSDSIEKNSSIQEDSNGVLNGTIAEKSNELLSISDTSEQATTGMTGLSLSMNGTSTYNAVTFDSGGSFASGRVDIHTDFAVTPTLLSGERFSVSGTLEGRLTFGHQVTNMLFNISSDDGKIVIGIFQTDQATKILVNGQEETEDQLKSEFGFDPSSL